MITFIGTFNIPKWSINYLKEIDDSTLTKEQINLIEKFKNELIKKYKALDIIFDFSFIEDEDFFIEHDSNEIFGEITSAWKIPVWIRINDDFIFQKYNIVITGYKNNRFQIIIFDNFNFLTVKEAKLWIHTYYYFLQNINIKIYESDKSDIIINNHTLTIE